jgi:hypothetical protein
MVGEKLKPCMTDDLRKLQRFADHACLPKAHDKETMYLAILLFDMVRRGELRYQRGNGFQATERLIKEALLTQHISGYYRRKSRNSVI